VDTLADNLFDGCRLRMLTERTISPGSELHGTRTSGGHENAP
jgi:hypothetical protein